MPRRSTICRGAAVLVLTISGAILASGCKSAPVAAPALPGPPPPATVDQKVGWILRLEQQRALRDPEVAAAPAAQTFAPAPVPDLAALARDTDPAIRRRAVLAIGRVGIASTVPLLATALSDPDAGVRESAAFALGLLGSRDGAALLQGALNDASITVRGRAIEALGLIGDTAAVPYILQAAAGCGPLLAPIAPDDEAWPKSPEIEVCRLALYAFVRLQSYNGIAAIALEPDGRPASRWWPVAYALQRLADPQAAAALMTLVNDSGVYTAGFALRGLAAMKHQPVVPVATTIAADGNADIKVRVAAVRAIAVAGSAEDVPALAAIAADPAAPPNLIVEAVTGLGVLGGPQAFRAIIGHLNAPRPAIRIAALTAAAKADSEAVLPVLSGLARDTDWTVRAALASALATLPPESITEALTDLANDEDARVHAAALHALAAVNAPGLTEKLFASLAAEDFAERATAARLIGDARPQGGAARLIAAYDRAIDEPTYVARGAALVALARYGAEAAVPTLQRALTDREWPIRWRAAELLRGLGQTAAEPSRPGPSRRAPEFYASRELLRPSFSPHMFIETRAGTIEVELNLTDATLTSFTLVELARSGFFNGISIHRVVPAFVIQAGDRRGDGEGGPGFTLPDELSATPFLRGTVGIALDWRDTGGSQWFIALAPQPHLDAKYSVVGRVVEGWDVLDRVVQGDVIERVRIWDGVEFK